MFQPRSIQSSLSLKDKLISIDYVLVFSILVLGGSQGAEVFGDVIPPVINLLKSDLIYSQIVEGITRFFQTYIYIAHWLTNLIENTGGNGAHVRICTGRVALNHRIV